jgi:hypothetical protein
MIHLSKAIEEAWRTTVEQVAQAEGEVQELARITADIPLDEEMGDQALTMMERIMQGEFEDYEPWERDDAGNYRRQLKDVVLVYSPGSRQLIVEASLTEQINTEVLATAEAGGFSVGEVAVEAVGRYYDDGWGGRTEEHARQEAQKNAERKLRDAIDSLHREQHAQEIDAATSKAHADATRQANEKLHELRLQTRDSLRQRLQVILADAEDSVYHTMNRLVGESYRRTLIDIVRKNGGRVLSDERTGSVYNLELELF